MSSTYTRALERNEALTRQQEIIAHIAFICGMTHAELGQEFKGRVMEKVNGSFGLMTTIVEWATEFDAWWEALPEEADRNFLEEIDDFAYQKYAELIGEITKERLTA